MDLDSDELEATRKSNEDGMVTVNAKDYIHIFCSDIILSMISDVVKDNGPEWDSEKLSHIRKILEKHNRL